MKGLNGLPTIIECLEALGVPFVYNGYSTSFEMECPFCKPRKKLNINTQKNVFNCPRCGIHGGVLDLYMIYDSTATTYSEACIKLKAAVKTGICLSGETIHKSYVSNKEKRTVEPASDEDRHKTYSALLNLLSLNSEDYNVLRKRGLSEKAIKKLGYKSAPNKLRFDVAKKLLAIGCKIEGVAGFVKYKGNWCFSANAKGIMIPFKNYKNQISAIQIRMHNTDKKRYVWLSTERICEKEPYNGGANYYTDGCKAVTCTHVVGFAGQKTVYLTEGALKGDVACYLSSKLFKKHKCFLCVGGVNNRGDFDKLFAWLKTNGVKRIVGTFDMDKVMCVPIYNENVYKARMSLKSVIEENGFLHKEYFWYIGDDTENYLKGIDDYYFNVYRRIIFEKRVEQALNETAA